MRYLILCLLTVSCRAGYFNWGRDDNRDSVYEKRTTTEPPNQPSNLGCFLCTQLLSVTKHRVGLSQNQLRNALYDKCRVLPVVFKDQCFTFVESSLPEIYFSLNYDFSTKDICVRLNLCDEGNPFAVGGPPPEEEEEQQELQENRGRVTSSSGEAEMISTFRPRTTTTTTTPTTTTTTTEKTPTHVYTQSYSSRPNTSRDRIGHKNVDDEREEDKRLTCAFCERMLENAKNYAVLSKTDITAFANSACTKLQKGQLADQCYQLADKKIAELAKFVDQQVVEALWCAELNQC